MVAKMRWNKMLRTFAFFLVTIISLSEGIETQDHAPSSDKTYHFPSASLTIAGDLKDVKLKGTIAQLVRALQQPSAPAPPVPQPKDEEAKPKTTGTKKIIHPSQLITKHTLGKGGKKLYYGDPVPDTITVASQSVKVSQSNNTGGKKTRHLGAFISNRPSPVRTIEGVRTADDEADKHYTWRNARVIKGFLVPNDRPANPHKKRQVIITDPQQYLAAAAAAQAQGATAIFDASGLQASPNGQPKTSIFYAQEPGSAGGVSNSANGASIFASSDPSHQRSHSHVAYPNQQPAQTTNNGQTGAFAYTPQQNSHMYVLQDGNAYNMQYNPNQVAAQQVQQAQQQAQSQFFSRSGEASTAPVASQNPSNSQQGSANNNHQQQQQQAQTQSTLSAAIRQQQYQSSLDTQAIQAAVEAVQQLEAQQQAAAAAGNNPQGSTTSTDSDCPTKCTCTASRASARSFLISGATAQEILAATAAATNGQVTAQYIQIQQGQEQPLGQLQQSQQQQQQQQYPAHNQFSERQAVPGVVGAYPASPAQFVIQPQTYLTGAGGQAFTVPIPVPVEQAVAQASHQQNQQARLHQQFSQHSQQQQYHNQNNQPHQNQNQQQQQHHSQHHPQQHSSNNNNNRQGPNQGSFTDKMKQAFNQNFNRKMLERVETNAVVPALASTGLFLGLSALAAGWYLSKSNREVGIVRRTGKITKKTGAATNPASETKDKVESPKGRTRRDLASMVTPGAYNPSGGPEVDQATFFQSIIQQSLEKTQKEYDDVEPVYQNQDGSAHMNNNNNEAQMNYHRGEPEPERHAPPSPPMPPQSRHRTKYNRYPERPAKYYRDDPRDDLYDPTGNSRISKAQQIQEKSGGWAVHSAKNFARVAIPAVVLTGAALGICAVIFGWYISGDNREIAFLESPTTNSIGQGQGGWSRRKRSLLGPTAISDGWLIRTLKAIHGNPYDNMPAPTAKSFVPYPYFLDKDSSKTSSLEFKVSNNGLAGVLAGGAVLAVVALGLINSFTESSGRNLKTARYNQLLTNSAAYTNSNSKNANPLTHLRSPRGMAHFENDLEFQQALSSPSFFESIVSSLEASGDTIMNKLHELGSAKWHESPCAKRILCQVMASQQDDTVKLMEKKMATVMKMLPASVSSSVNENLSDVLSAINKRDCSAFACSSTHHNKSTARIVHINAAPSSSHHKSSSIKIEQTVTNSR
ncbi:hypothetical protein Ocin01_15157 [Orchesella cincta]|uniref:Uncharacterized protein n=1 Tax=Orchesella cincta TaxID=48709 RepID=A0A1D2MET3_ORCCI|nr:hypothetical protein Ocin01_15157 [Orchesella cincta]